MERPRLGIRAKHCEGDDVVEAVELSSLFDGRLVFVQDQQLSLTISEVQVVLKIRVQYLGSK